VSIKATVLTQIEEMRDPSRGDLPALTDDLALLDSGLDSLGIAVLVTRLEDAFGFDPFTESEITTPPVTLGDFIRLYERAAKAA
jgi:acyl carrier protein